MNSLYLITHTPVTRTCLYIHTIVELRITIRDGFKGCMWWRITERNIYKHIRDI